MGTKNTIIKHLLVKGFIFSGIAILLSVIASHLFRSGYSSVIPMILGIASVVCAVTGFYYFIKYAIIKEGK